LIAFVLGSGQPASASCISCACTVATTSLNFGSYVFTEAAPTIAAAPISFLCTSASSAAGSVTISLSSGGGTFTARTMRFGANTLRYNVFLDPTHALIFGDGSDGTSFYNSGTFTIGSTAYAGTATVYAAIPAGQGAIPPGTYSDAITETISF
jgi:spore coat protein U-like protein